MSVEERRVLDAEAMRIHIEERDGEPAKIVGRIPYNMWSKDLGGFRETVRSTAFEKTLADGDDVKARIEHKDGLTRIGRTKNQTLRLIPKEDALEWEVTPANTSAGRDIVELVRRGDIDKGSFAFRIRTGGDRWASGNDGLMRRELLDADLIDVAPVSSPAYEDITVAVRSYEARKAEESEARGRADRYVPSEPARRAAVERYGLTARLLAIHEAGHAVMRILQGGSIEFVRLNWREGPDRKPHLAGGVCRNNGDGSTLQTSLAGRAAEDIAIDFSPELRSGRDGFTDATDMEKARPLIERRRGLGVDEYHALRETGTILRQHWGAVCALTDAILERERVNGDLATRIVMENVDDLARRRIGRIA